MLPKGLVRVRSYGWLANRHRRQQLALCRKLLNAAGFHMDAASAPANSAADSASLPACPVCGHSAWRAVELLSHAVGEPAASSLREDSS